MTPMAGRFTCRRPPPTLNRENVMKASQLIESLPRLGGGWSANHQRIEMTGARVGCPVCSVGLSRGASIQSVVEPARRRFMKSSLLPFAFLQPSWHQALTQDRRGGGLLSEVDCPPGNRPIMAAHSRAVQSNAAAGHISGSNLTPESLRLRQVRRVAAGFNKSPEPTAVAAAVAIHAASRRWLSFLR
jgi:hypothetical protein